MCAPILKALIECFDEQNIERRIPLLQILILLILISLRLDIGPLVQLNSQIMEIAALIGQNLPTISLESSAGDSISRALDLDTVRSFFKTQQ